MSRLLSIAAMIAMTWRWLNARGIATARGGRDSIDHAPGAHDDLVNAVAGVAAVNNQYGGYNTNYKEWAY